jgi:hypothetical protein
MKLGSSIEMISWFRRILINFFLNQNLYFKNKIFFSNSSLLSEKLKEGKTHHFNIQCGLSPF